MPKVSVIVPTYNRASYLKEAIQSILDQEFQDFDIVITDNASSDETESVVAAFASSKICYYKNETNIGVVNNHNKALSLATGTYICVFSDDDIMLQDNLTKKIAVLEKYESVVLVHSNVFVINEKGDVVGSHWAERYYDKWKMSHDKDGFFTGTDYFKVLYCDWNIISMPSVIFRRNVLDEVLEFNIESKYFCDWDMWMRMVLYGDVYYLQQPLVKYRMHSTNTINELNKNNEKAELVLIKNMLSDKYGDVLNRIGIRREDIEASVARQIHKYPFDAEPSEPHLFLKLINRMRRII